MNSSANITLKVSRETAGSHRSISSKLLARKWLGAFIPFVLFLGLCWVAVDFGNRWDEDYDKADAIEYTLNNGYTFLPNSYVYPGVNYWLTFTCLTPEIVSLYSQHTLDRQTFRQRAIAILHTPAFRLRVRRVDSFVAALTLLWIYLTVLVWRGSRSEAIVASLLVALSWQVIYHSRWIAPDQILMQFGALTIYLVFLFLKQDKRAFLWLAAASAGLACGAKYPGALVLLPVLTAVWMNRYTRHRPLRDSAIVITVFTVVYLFTTPGTLIQPFKFWASLRYEMDVYSRGWYGYTVHPGFGHLWKVVVYFAIKLFSTNMVLALMAFLMVPVGLINVIRDSRREALVFLIFPVVYSAYFSTQRAMIVRNYLVLIPFVAILAAAGFGWLQARFTRSGFRWVMPFCIGLLFVFNFTWEVQAAQSIVNRRDTEAFLRQFMNYVIESPGKRFLVSPKLEDVLKAHNFAPPNIAYQRSESFSKPFDMYAAYYSECVSPRAWEWASNRPGTFLKTFGPREFDPDYYVGWVGDDRIVVLSRSHAFKWRVDKPPLRNGP